MSDPDTGNNFVRKFQFAEIAAFCFDYQTDCFTFHRVKQFEVDQPTVYGSIEQRVMNNIIHMSVDIVIGPSGLKRAEHHEFFTG